MEENKSESELDALEKAVFSPPKPKLDWRWAIVLLLIAFVLLFLSFQGGESAVGLPVQPSPSLAPSPLTLADLNESDLYFVSCRDVNADGSLDRGDLFSCNCNPFNSSVPEGEIRLVNALSSDGQLVFNGSSCRKLMRVFRNLSAEEWSWKK